MTLGKILSWLITVLLRFSYDHIGCSSSVSDDASMRSSEGNCSPSTQLVESPISHRLSDSEPSLNSSHIDDSPLSLAEAVVRVGQRVIAATLSTVDSSLGIDPFWGKVSQQLLSENLNPQIEPRLRLHRSTTVPAECQMLPDQKIILESRRVPLRNIINNPFSTDEQGCLHNTPAFGRKRINAFIQTPLNAGAKAACGTNDTPLECHRFQRRFAQIPPVDDAFV